MENKVLLEVKNVTKLYPGTRALSNVNLTVNKGEVHSLVGENGAGKSTLMKIIAGVTSLEEGQIVFEGKTIRFHNPREAQEAGIGLVHQELSLCPHLSVAENVFMGRLPKKGSFIDYATLNKNCEKLLERFHVNFKPQQTVSALNVAEQQIVEIAKAISFNCKLLILDEPTSSLTQSESDVLFSIIDDLKRKGISVLYISHRMVEIFAICDKITVLRDGHLIKTLQTKECDVEQIIGLMVGREIGNIYPPKSQDIKQQEILRVDDLCVEGLCKDINFTLYEGEILGFSGLIGSGRTELMRALCGIDSKPGGGLYLKGKKIEITDYRSAIKNGIGYLTEDRKAQGLFLDQSIQHNISSASLDQILSFKFLINPSKEIFVSNTFAERLQVKRASLKQPVESLSGGNQQKVMIAKWLAIFPKVLILDEPTRGIDVGAKTEIHKLVRRLADEGIGVILISSDLPEIIGMSDRVVVMHERKIQAIVKGEDIQEEIIMRYASGH